VINTTVRRRILLAVAVSGAVHAAAIALGPRHTEEAIPDLPPLEARLVKVAPPPTAAPPPPVAPQRRPARVHRETKIARVEPAPLPPTLTTPEREALPSDASGPEEIAGQETPAAEAAAPESPPTPATEPTIVATAPSSTFSPEARPLPDFPRSGRIAYSLLYGREQFPVGRTVQSWKIDGTRYQLASHSETTGLAKVLRSQYRTYFSRGELTPEGFRPDTFLMSRNRGRGPEEARATFHWDAGTVTLGSGGKQHEEPLSRGSQDLMSFMYQLSIEPPAPGRRTVIITNGSRVDTYDINVLPEEKVETPLGLFRALPVTQVRKPDTESMDVWLAVEYRYLPIRIRFYTRKGEAAGEQLVTEIRLSDE
jgi:hypothetical protein